VYFGLGSISPLAQDLPGKPGKAERNQRTSASIFSRVKTHSSESVAFGDARLKVAVRQPMFAQSRAAQAEKVIRPGRNSAPTIEVITYALRKRQEITGGGFVEQHVEPFISRIQRHQIDAAVAGAMNRSRQQLAH
jgi:hypothetical protein